MKTMWMTAVLCFVTVLSAGAGPGRGDRPETPKSDRPDKRPNVILVITDDQGYGDLGCHGNPHILTPHLDEFAGEAVRFTNFHVSTTCAPTRGALMTGRYTNRLNVFHTINGRSLLWADEVLLPQVLAENGYTCGMFGKWHLGDNYPFRPGDRGFHEVVRHGGGGVGQMPDYWGNDYFDDSYWHNGEPESYEGYCTDVFFGEALRFIEEQKDGPFFCYISTNAPHGPLNVPEAYVERYAGNAAVPAKQKRFYGMISNIDDNFAVLRERLELLGIAENTILIFMTDNGTAYGAGVYNAGMRGQKGSEYEGGHRVPFMLRWPRGGMTGGEVDELTAHFDVLPTLVDMLGLQYQPLKMIDGYSLLPLLKGRDDSWPGRMLFVDTQRRLNLVKDKQYSVMTHEWRLVNGNELYDMLMDPGQTENVFGLYPEVAADLSEGYRHWWEDIMADGVNERYAYIVAGSRHENPVRLCSHDLLTAELGYAWHQHGAVGAVPASGCWKVKIAADGDYRISLRRYPRESGLGINARFPAMPADPRIENPMPESRKSDFERAFLYIAGFTGSRDISSDTGEVSFEMRLPEGQFDMEARLIDSGGVVHPAYYVYIEKI